VHGNLAGADEYVFQHVTFRIRAIVARLLIEPHSSAILSISFRVVKFLLAIHPTRRRPRSRSRRNGEAVIEPLEKRVQKLPASVAAFQA
jgi:hypothetical protein